MAGGRYGDCMSAREPEPVGSLLGGGGGSGGGVTHRQAVNGHRHRHTPLDTRRARSAPLGFPWSAARGPVGVLPFPVDTGHCRSGGNHDDDGDDDDDVEKSKRRRRR